MAHKVLEAHVDALRHQIIRDLLIFGELTDRPDDVSAWRWFDKMCYQHDSALAILGDNINAT